MKNDLIVGLLALAFAGIYYYLANDIPRSLLADGVGADGLPKLYAVALGLLSALLILRSLASQAVPTEPVAPEDSGAISPWRQFRPLGLAGLGAGYLLLISSLGYLVTIFLLIIAVAVYSGGKMDFKLIFISAGGGILLWLVFVKMFSIPLPSGTLWQWLTG
ncbi:MAG TPA: tripartite tricarboxylate transporter TctB family protein [Acidiferrobacterales bacterium]|nr:tripartite tricarboxylate transporter TctB family protein [Acidiferrobacterales bacterium]